MSTYHDLYSVDFDNVNRTATRLEFSTAEQQDAVEWVRVWGSSDGLLLVSDEGNSNLILLNPSTRECKKLPTCPFFHALVGVGEFVAYAYGIGYDSCTDGYEVVMLSYSGLSHITIVAVYSLRNDAWRRLRDFPSMLMRYTCGVLFNGCLHWLGWRAGSFAIVAINLPDEIFKEVPLPGALNACTIGYSYELVVLGDCLCLVSRPLSYQFRVWMMKEYGVRESWNKITIERPERPRLILLGLLAEDELLFKSNEVILDGDKTKKLVVYNPKKRTMRDIVVCGIPSEFAFRGTYVESLVSPHHRGGIGRQ